MKVYIECSGCEQRQLDTQRVVNFFQRNNIEIVQNPQDSTHSIYITCAVDSVSEEYSKKRVGELITKMGSPDKVIVGGCLPSISPDHISSSGIVETFSPRTLDNLEELLEGCLVIPFSEIGEFNESYFDIKNRGILQVDSMSPREQYDTAKKGFKIQVDYGCLLKCSYCMIRNATGKLKSKPLNDVLHEFQKGIEQEEPTIMFVGGDTGAYGYDIDKNTRLHTVLENVLPRSKIQKIFIHDFNIGYFLRDYEGYMKVFELNSSTINRIGGIMFPVQSGSDKILKLMRRPAKSREIIEKLSNLKNQHPSINIGTHIIVGFPDEEKEDFEQTVGLLEQIDFDFVTCFPYSEHMNAPSSSIVPKISIGETHQRLEVLDNLFGDKIKIVK
ncbi:MAG: radical SAM protein [Candidatus Woesearchaeota archaeon]|nr:radical SAM protein [Nanoarchaeota archaeon]USN44323.1 MAG: radical SAM protein [Candidatus Woesearchaeota archaeon]